jgi:hypothetical protein
MVVVSRDYLMTFWLQRKLKLDSSWVVGILHSLFQLKEQELVNSKLTKFSNTTSRLENFRSK